jgi:hypothetical protein
MEYRTLLYGVLLLLLMRFQPEGILGDGSVIVRGWQRLLRSRRNVKATTDNGKPANDRSG